MPWSVGVHSNNSLPPAGAVIIVCSWGKRDHIVPYMFNYALVGGLAVQLDKQIGSSD